MQCNKSACPAYGSGCNSFSERILKQTDVLFILSSIDKDFYEGKILSSPTGKLFSNVLNHVLKESKYKTNISIISIVKGIGKTSSCWNYCKDNVYKQILKINPKLIVAVGKKATSALFEDNPDDKVCFLNNRNTCNNILIGNKSYKILSIPDTLKAIDSPSILCTVVEGVRRALKVYPLSPIKEGVNRIIPSSIKEVGQVIKHLMNVKTEAIAFDTETFNLNRVYKNRLASIQFCYNPKDAYFIWLDHPNSPFDPIEQRKIKNYLHFFLSKNNNNFKYFVAHNAKFDLAILLSLLKTRVINPVICTMTFPFILDENYVDSPASDFKLKTWAKNFGFKGYNAEDLAVRKAGRLWYLPKSNFEEYSTNDVIVTIQLYYILKEMAKGQRSLVKVFNKEKNIYESKYSNYLKPAMNLMVNFYSRVYKFLVEIENNGININIPELNYLQSDNSPILKDMEKIKNNFKKSKYAIETNKLLSKENCVAPTLPWVENKKIWHFDIDKVDHKRLLFFYNMKLKPTKDLKIRCPRCKNDNFLRENCKICKGTGRNKIFDNKGFVSIAGQKFLVGAMDTSFKDAYLEDYKEVKDFDEYNKLKKLKTSYVKTIDKFLDPEKNYADYYIDKKIRPNFSLMAKTGRAKTSNPNSQQIPRGDTETKKSIKRLFCTPQGYAIVALDYMAIEVRGWGILSNDVGMAKMFKEALKWRNIWKKTEDLEAKQKAINYGDIHIANASAMYQISPEEVTKNMRQSSKGLTFGSIYGMSLESMAKVMNCTVEEAKLRKLRAFSKFKEAGKWLKDTAIFGRQYLYIQSPLGRRRRSWEFLINNIGAQNFENKWLGKASRQIVNAPIQGFASDITFLAASLLLEELILKENKPWKLNNVVHDAIYAVIPISDIEEYVLKVDDFFTKRVIDIIYKDFGFKIPFPLEVEHEIGLNNQDLEKWDFSKTHLKQIIDNVKEKDSTRSTENKFLPYKY